MQREILLNGHHCCCCIGWSRKSLLCDFENLLLFIATRHMHWDRCCCCKVFKDFDEICERMAYVIDLIHKLLKPLILLIQIFDFKDIS